MSEENKAIIKKTKELLEEYGYDVKNSHLYEVFSKLSGESSWNVASAKKTSFKKLIQKELSLTELVKNLTSDTLVEVVIKIAQAYYGNKLVLIKPLE